MRRWIQEWRVSDEPFLPDPRLIRATKRGMDGHVAWLENPRRTKWDRFRSSMKGRLDDFWEKYGTPSQLEKTDAYLTAAISNAFKENFPLHRKPLDAVSFGGTVG